MTELEGVDQGSGDQGKINPAEGGIADDLTWLGRGFFQPLYNLQFYRAAVGKSLVEAIIFFVAFATLLTIITTLNLTRELGAVSDDIEQAFASGAFPDLVIENGLATVRGRQPLILLDEQGTIVVLDTTGIYQSIDTGRYTQGLLLTRDSLHAYSDGNYQVIQLRDLNSALGNPIVVNRESALDAWRSLTSIFAGVAFIGIGLWYLVARSMWLTFLAVLVWGTLSAFKVRSEYGPVLTLGIYALVPAVYVSFLLGLIGVSFCGLQLGLLLLVWVLVARSVLKAGTASESPDPLQ
ncbi:MAG: DUF1189 family protein [Chloroflexi bacterium]|nr:DUF1189 family protein [Chloroflexota bacterium]